ncbi:MAG: hypothetical protein PHW13_11305, partial [Methylococcales bacterium]|nr:hypothetical protein [Methylococcales bacterium]
GFHGGGGGFHGGGFHGGYYGGGLYWGLGGMYGYPYYGYGYGYAYPYGGYGYGYGYPYAYPYFSGGMGGQSITYIQQNAPVAQQNPPGYWYYCRNPEGYYPYVKECPQGWQQVSPTPQK